MKPFVTPLHEISRWERRVLRARQGRLKGGVRPGPDASILGCPGFSRNWNELMGLYGDCI